MRKLIVITGPVAAGKSTAGLALAERLRRPETRVAVIDLDQLYCMVRQESGFGEEESWQAARRGAAALATSFFADGVRVVIVEGEFFRPEELSALTERVPLDARRHFVTLRVSYGEALRRAQGDPLRQASKNPAFLRWLHGNFEKELPFLQAASSVIDADVLAPPELAERIAETL